MSPVPQGDLAVQLTYAIYLWVRSEDEVEVGLE